MSHASHYQAMHELVEAAKAVGAIILDVGPSPDRHGTRVTLTWPGVVREKVTIDSPRPERIVALMPNLTSDDAARRAEEQAALEAYRAGPIVVGFDAVNDPRSGR